MAGAAQEVQRAPSCSVRSLHWPPTQSAPHLRCAALHSLHCGTQPGNRLTSALPTPTPGDSWLLARVLALESGMVAYSRPVRLAWRGGWARGAWHGCAALSRRTKADRLDHGHARVAGCGVACSQPCLPSCSMGPCYAPGYGQAGPNIPPAPRMAPAIWAAMLAAACSSPRLLDSSRESVTAGLICGEGVGQWAVGRAGAEVSGAGLMR